MRRIRHAVAGLALASTLASGAMGSPLTDAVSGSWGVAPPAMHPEPEPETLAPLAAPGMGSAFAYRSLLVTDELLAARGMTRRKREPKPPKPEPDSTPADADTSEGAATPEHRTARERARGMGGLPGALSGDRARLMLQSLTLPGWGQARLGKPRAALAFALIEAGVWGSYTAFRVQEHMRRETYERTARLFGAIELDRRDEEYRRIVGLYLSSEEYNRLVVRRDAANLYFGDPAGYDAYIAAHELKGADAWAWGSEEDLLRYRVERQASQRAIKHAHDALAAAVINRLLSVIHAARSSGVRAPDHTSWRVECVPAGGDPTAFRLALSADF
jgi:hypothetical protein